MSDIIIIGAGGHAAEIDEYIAASHLQQNVAFKIIGFLDDSQASYARYQFSAPFLGRVSEHHIRSDVRYIIGIANLKYRKPIVDDFLRSGAKFISFVHPTAYVSKSASIGDGVVVGPYANIGPNVKIGDFTLINARVSVGHDSQIGRYNFIAPNVSFSGFTTIGDENLFGINSATIPGIEVGSRNKIAAGMILDKSIDNDTVVFHRYKEKIIAVQKN